MVDRDDLLALADNDRAPGSRPWWGDYSLPEGHHGMAWRIGPLHLLARRWGREWRLAWRNEDDALDATLAFDSLPDVDDSDCTVERYAFRETGRGLRLVPRVADRSVVVRPDIPLYIPAGESAEVFVSTSVWVEIHALDEAGVCGKVLTALPAYRPSDSWFGPNTREGDLCYASRSLARLQLEDVVQRPHRILSPVTIWNRGEDHLLIERLNVPLPMLAVHASDRGQLWTQPVVIERGKAGGYGTLKLDEIRLPEELKLEKLSEPREIQGRQGLFRALDRLFG